MHVLGNISTISQVSSGEETNRLQFYNIGAATYDIASIRAFVGAGQANRGELGFYVNNGASQQLAMYIDRSQNVGIGTASPANTVKLDVVGDIRTSTGILFGTDTAAANLLDDYEEGTWTIGLQFGGASTGMTTSSNAGTYTKLGRKVTVNGFFALSNKGSSTGVANITGLPFAIGNSNSNYSAASLRLNVITVADYPQGYGSINTTNIVLEEVTNAGVITSLTNSDFANTSEIILSFTYFV